LYSRVYIYVDVISGHPGSIFFLKRCNDPAFSGAMGHGQGGTVLAKEMGNTIRSHSLKKLNP
jgi:hypothetical protein